MKPPATNREQQQSDGGSGRLGSGRKKVSKGRFIHLIVIMLEIISRAHPRLISRPATAKMSPKQSRHFATLPSTDNSAAALSDGRTIGRSDRRGLRTAGEVVPWRSAGPSCRLQWRQEQLFRPPRSQPARRPAYRPLPLRPSLTYLRNFRLRFIVPYCIPNFNISLGGQVPEHNSKCRI